MNPQQQESTHNLADEPAGAVARDERAGASGERPAAPRLESSDPLVGTVLEGAYRLERPLGAGRIGHVYLGTQVRTGARLAVKIVDLDEAVDLAIGMLDVVRATMAIHSVHVVRPLDVGTLSTRRFYVVREYLEGEDLDELLAREGPQAWPRVAFMALQVCRGLASALRGGLVHGRLHPRNCLRVTMDGNTDHIAVLDFSVVRATDEAPHSTRHDAPPGEAEDTAPGLATDASAADTRSDLHALGVIMFKLLTGAVPQLDAPGVPPSRAAPRRQIPGAADVIVMRALARDPGQRFADPEEMEAALREALIDLERGEEESATARALAGLDGGASGGGSSSETTESVIAALLRRAAQEYSEIVPPAPPEEPSPAVIELVRSLDEPEPAREEPSEERPWLPMIASLTPPPAPAAAGPRRRVFAPMMLVGGAIAAVSLIAAIAYGSALPGQPQVEAPTRVALAVVAAEPPARAPAVGTVVVAETAEFGAARPEVPLVPLAVDAEPAEADAPGALAEVAAGEDEEILELDDDPAEAPTVSVAPGTAVDFDYRRAERMIDGQWQTLRGKCLGLVDPPPARVTVRVAVSPRGRARMQVATADAGVQECIHKALGFPFPRSTSGGAFEYTITPTQTSMRRLALRRSASDPSRG